MKNISWSTHSSKCPLLVTFLHDLLIKNAMNYTYHTSRQRKKNLSFYFLFVRLRSIIFSLMQVLHFASSICLSQGERGCDARWFEKQSDEQKIQHSINNHIHNTMKTIADITEDSKTERLMMKANQMPNFTYNTMRIELVKTLCTQFNVLLTLICIIFMSLWFK